MSMSHTQVPLWLLVALQAAVSGVSLVVEIVAGRMLAPYVGMSLYTWTSIIAVVLAGFSIGHWWGGHIAERPARQALSLTGWVMLAAAVSTAGALLLLRVIGGPVLAAVEHPVWAIVTLTCGVFFLPSLFAGVPAPVLAQIAVMKEQSQSGRSLGAMFASGAVGAIAGTLLAGFVFIPWLGTALTLAIVTVIYLCASAILFALARPVRQRWPLRRWQSCSPGYRSRGCRAAPRKASISASVCSTSPPTMSPRCGDWCSITCPTAPAPVTSHARCFPSLRPCLMRLPGVGWSRGRSLPFS